MTELNPCPNPECQRVAAIDIERFGGGYKHYRVICDCGYRSPPGQTEEEASENHNLLATPRWIPVEESLPEPGEFCEAWAFDGEYHHSMWIDTLKGGRVFWSDGEFRRFLDETEDEQRITHWRKQTIPHPPRKA